jgi:lysozyme
MSKAAARVSLALWTRRLAYRQRRHAYWHKRHDQAKAAKWHRLVAEAQARISLRRRQIAAPVKPAEPIPAKGVDVSNLQGYIDWPKVKAADYRFAYVKAGEGDWRDPDFLRNVKAAKDVGLKVGAYQFLRPKPGRTGAQEAAFFIAQLEHARLGKGDLLPVLDVEATKLDRAGTHAYVKSFANAMRAHGFRPLIYTGTWFWNPKVGDDDFGCPLWIAAYQSSEPKLPKPWTRYLIWQHSSSGQMPGISGDVDLNKTPDLRKVIA